MKNLIKLFGIIALVAVIGFSMTACEENTPTLQGNWSGVYSLVINGSNFILKESPTLWFRGTFTSTATQITYNTVEGTNDAGSSWSATTGTDVYSYKLTSTSLTLTHVSGSKFEVDSPATLTK